jgi:hypothetical protein
VTQISGDATFDHHALCFKVQLVGFNLNQIVFGPAPRRTARWFAVLISRPVFLYRLLLVGRGHGANAAHFTKVDPKR